MLRTKKRFFLLFVIVGLIATLASCASSKKYVKLTFDKDCYEIYKGQTIEVAPLINKGSNVGEVVIEYSSHDDSIATYANGKLQGVEYGTTVIKVVYANNVTICDTARVVVVEHDVEGNIQVDETPIVLSETGAAYTIPHTTDYAEVEYTFESSNEDVATVDANGVVTPVETGAKVNDGKAVITVTAKDVYGATEDVVFTIDVTVKEAHYGLTFDLAEGKFEGTLPVEYDMNALPVALPEPTRDGYTFAGWLINGAEEAVKEIVAGSEGVLNCVAKWEENKYNVTYDLVEGQLPEGKTNPADYLADAEVTLVEPVKKGHTFAGWLVNGTEIEGNVLPTDKYVDLEVKATWTVNTYKITYVDNSATKNENAKEFTFGKGYTFIAPVKAGYEFQGWFTDEAYTAENKLEAVAADCDKDVTVYAKWALITFTVTLDVNGGDSLDNVTYTIVSDTIVLEKATRTGYTFKGWFNGETEVKEIVSGSEGNLTLVAKWEANTYKIEYETNNAQTNENANTFTFDKGYTFIAPVKAGYKFLGWYTEETYENKLETIAADTAKDVKVWAKWEIVTYKVTFDAKDGEAVDSIEYTITSDTIVLKPTTKTGYTFKGWFDDETEVKEITTGSTGDKALVAKWEANTYKIEYVTNGAQTNENEDTFTFGTAYTFNTPVKAGYKFLGWYTEETYENKLDVIAADTAKDVKVWAKWEIVTYTVTFDADGGKEVDVLEYTIVSETITLEATTKKGHTFLGWFDGETEVKEITTGSTGNKELVANWDADTYNITYVTDGALTNTNDATYDFGVGYKFAEPVKPGYDFVAWYTDEARTEANRIDTIAADAEGDITVYAKWSIVTYTVTFDAKGGKDVDAFEYQITSETKVLAETTRTGYKFVGWFDGETEVKEITTGSTGNKELVAKWEANEHTITYVTNGADINENASTFKYDAAYTFKAPVKTGHKFIGWYTDEACTEANKVTEVALNTDEDVKVWAKWQVLQFTITFNTNGGTEIAAITQDYNTEVKAPENPTKTGYAFNGWDTTIPEKMPAKDLTITASWLANKYTITFDSNGGSEVAPITQDFESELKAPTAPTLENYDFVAWVDADGNVYVFDKVEAKDITLKATWKATEYKIEYVGVPVTAENTNPVKYTVESEDIVLTDLEVEHFDFLGWFSDPECTVEFEKIAKGSSGDVKVYSKWNATIYNIVYNVDKKTTFEGATVVLNKDGKFYTEYTNADEIVLPKPVLAGFEFLGWFDNEALEGEAVTKVEVGAFGTLNFYPKWQARTYSITFVVAPVAGLPTVEGVQMYEIEGLETPQAIEYTINSPEINFAVLTAEGYEFAGWYFVNDGTLVKLGSILPAEQHGNFTFYALWKKLPVEETPAA